MVILCVFALSNTADVPEKKEIQYATVVPPIKKEETPDIVQHYSENETLEVTEKLDYLLKRINRRQDFHGSLLVAKKGKIIYHNHIGYENFKEKNPVNDLSVFQLASVSKQFTAAAIMLLFEQQKLDLKNNVNQFFPNFPYKNVTIKQLLNHTAGLPKYFWIAEHKWKNEKAPTNSEMMALLETANTPKFYRPGRTFDYSNTAYFVLASIVEQVSGENFRDFVQKNIFAPLQMNDSYVYSYENDSIRPHQLMGYRIYRGWKHLPINGTINDAIVGDKNVYTTSLDLFKWFNGLHSGKLLSKLSLHLMFSKGETTRGRKIPYGFGFRIAKSRKENKIYHHGRWNGFRTGLTYYPEDELTVIILEHTSFNGIPALNKKVKTIVDRNFSL